MPPDLVIVLMTAPVNPPYSAGWPRPPTWTSSMRFWLKKVQADAALGVARVHAVEEQRVAVVRRAAERRAAVDARRVVQQSRAALRASIGMLNSRSCDMFVSVAGSSCQPSTPWR